MWKPRNETAFLPGEDPVRTSLATWELQKSEVGPGSKLVVHKHSPPPSEIWSFPPCQGAVRSIGKEKRREWKERGRREKNELDITSKKGREWGEGKWEEERDLREEEERRRRGGNRKRKKRNMVIIQKAYLACYYALWLSAVYLHTNVPWSAPWLSGPPLPFRLQCVLGLIPQEQQRAGLVSPAVDKWKKKVRRGRWDGERLKEAGMRRRMVRVKGKGMRWRRVRVREEGRNEKEESGS